MKFTTAQLAAAIELDVESVRRYLKRKPNPLTGPEKGEKLEAWAERAKQWRADNLKRPGPKPRTARGTELDEAELRKKVAEASLKELELAERQGALHSVPECEALAVLRYERMSAAFGTLGDVLARRCARQPPDVIKGIVDEEVGRRLEIVAAGSNVVDESVHAAAAAGDSKA